MKGAAIKGILKGKGKGVPLPPDSLAATALQCARWGHAGFPEATDSLAYDPVQRLAAVGTADGRVKLIGRRGAEVLLTGGDESGTRQLLFLSGKGALARVTAAGDLQLWGLDSPRLLAQLPFPDAVIALEQVPESPYLCLGCESGALRFVQLTAASGSPAAGVCQAHGLELLPYELWAEELGVEGALLSLAAACSGEQQRLLGLHSQSGALVWDLRQQACVSRTATLLSDGGEGAAELAEAGPARCACWVGDSCLSFATGHEMGGVLVWVLPAETGAPSLVLAARVAPGADVAMPLRRLLFVEGGCAGGSSSLLAFGGQVLDQPDTLSLIALDGADAAPEPAAQPLPWYGAVRGFAAVPRQGAAGAGGEAAAVLVLSEGGQLVLFPLPELQPVPLGLALQELPDLTVSHLAAAPPAALEQLREAAAQAQAAAGGADRSAERWRWVLGAGRLPAAAAAPPGACELLLTGHRDGRVRLWGCGSAAPQLLLTVPFDAGGAGARLRPVTALEAQLQAGLLAVGHEQGEVRLYQLCPRARAVASLELSGSGARPRREEEAGRLQPAGFQRLLRLRQHAGDVSCLALAPADGLLACGDASGALSLTDLSEPAVAWAQPAGEALLAGLALCSLPSAPSVRASTECRRDGGGCRPVAVALSSEGGLAAFDCASGQPLAPKLCPRSPDTALCLALLDSQGGLLLPPAAAAAPELPWAACRQPEPAPEAGTGLRADVAGHLLAARRSSARSIALSTPSALSAAPSAEPASPAWHSAESHHTHQQPDGQSMGSPHDDASHASLLSQPSADEDSFLAAAAEEAAAAREPERGGRRPRLKALLRGEVPAMQQVHSMAQRLSGRPASEEGSRAPSEAGGRRGESAARRDDSFRRDVSFRRQEAAALPARSDAGAEDGSQLAVQQVGPAPLRSAFAGGPQPQQPLPSPAFLVVATAAHVRLYPADCLQSGERTTARKATLEETIALAAPFRAAGGSGLACISAAGGLQVLSLPGLEPLLQASLQAALGFPWSWAREPAMAPALPRLCSVGADGQLLLVGPGCELARASLAAPSAGWRPAEAEGLHDWQLATAAAAAAAASKRSHSSSLSEEAPAEEAAARGGEPLQPGSADHRRGLGGFLHQVRDGVVSVGVNVGTLVEGTGRGLGRGLHSLPAHLPALGRGRAPGGEAAARLPPLDRVLSETRPRPPQPPAPSDRPEQDPARRQLLAGRAQRPGARTADDIKRAYGRPTARRAEGVAAQAEANRARLAERGERLGQLGTKAESMAADAQDFASLARALRDREAERKWWQM